MVGTQGTKSFERPSWCWLTDTFRNRQWRGCTQGLLQRTPKEQRRLPWSRCRSFATRQPERRDDISKPMRPIRADYPWSRSRVAGHFERENEASASMSWGPILGSQGQRDSVIPPLQCPLGIPNWSGQHQERRLGTVPSVTETVEASASPTTESIDPVDCSLLGGNISNDCFSFIFRFH